MFSFKFGKIKIIDENNVLYNILNRANEKKRVSFVELRVS
jgi:hypothetical protein